MSGSSTPDLHSPIQNVKDLLVKPGQNMSIECSIKDMVSYTLSWYRQRVWGRSLDYIADEAGNIYNSELQSHISVIYTPKKDLMILKVTQLELNDSAQYYCATGHLVSNPHKVCTKT